MQNFWSFIEIVFYPLYERYNVNVANFQMEFVCVWIRYDKPPKSA